MALKRRDFHKKFSILEHHMKEQSVPETAQGTGWREHKKTAVWDKRSIFHLIQTILSTILLNAFTFILSQKI